MNGEQLAGLFKVAQSGLDMVKNLIPRKEAAPAEAPLPPAEDVKGLRQSLNIPQDTPVSADMTPSTATAEDAPREVTESQNQAPGVATACVPCALGHFSTSAGLLNEAVRFKKKGITSNDILDRIAKVLQEQNALERVDLTPEKIGGTPDWERDLAEKALQQSRGLRHRLETTETIADLERAAADTEGYYRNLNREWWKRRLATPSKKKEPELTLDEAKRLAAEEATKEVERRWQSQEKT